MWDILIDNIRNPWYASKDKWPRPAARRIPVLPLLRQDIFLSRKENSMTMYAKKNVMSDSLGAAFADSIRASVSIPERSVFQSNCYCDFSWFFWFAYAFQRAGFFYGRRHRICRESKVGIKRFWCCLELKLRDSSCILILHCKIGYYGYSLCVEAVGL